MTASKITARDTAAALQATLISPSESDSNGEPANAVDGLFAISRAIESLATAVTRIAHGDVTGPTGLELLSMAITGPGATGHDSLTSAIREGFGDLAEVVSNASE